MKKTLKLTTLILTCMLFIGLQYADAQRRGEGRSEKETDQDDEYFDESGGFAHKLWYGGGFNFSISSGSGYNALAIGISPMLGYKIDDRFSIGPRATINYFNFYIAGPNARYLEWGVGAFGRAKLFNSIFAHLEYSYESISQTGGPDIFLLPGGTDNFYLGGGYNSSAGAGGFGYEILILYNVLEEDEFIVPIEYRVGFTYNF